MAGAYHVKLPAVSGQTLYGGVDTAVVYADSAADAKLMAKARFPHEDDNAWTNATATEIVVGTDLEGWTFRVVLTDPATDAVAADVEYTGVATDDIDDVGAGLVTALNALDNIAGAAYDTGTNVLKVAETTDALGDHALTVYAYAPEADFLGARDNSVTGFISTITDEGAEADAVTVVLVAHTIPVVYGVAKSY